MQAVPQLSNIRQVSDGWIKKYVLAYTMPDGSTYEYESASRKSLDAYRAELEGNAAGRACAADAVCIVPQTATGELLLIREFRYPLNSWCIAFPAGLMEPGEDLATCVDRELREETGYALRTDADADAPALDPLPQAGYSSTGLTDETVHVVFAQVEKVADAQPEPAEFIEPFLLPIADVPRFLAENETPIGIRAQLVLEGRFRQHGVRDHADVGHEAHQLDALERRLRCAQPFEQVCRTERRLLEHLVRRTDELGDAPVQRVSGRALDAVLHRQVAPFLGFQIVATMRVERERDHVGRAAVLFDFRGYGLLQKLGTGKAQRSVHEIVLIVHYDQQALHALLPSFSACHLFSFPSISA